MGVYKESRDKQIHLSHFWLGQNVGEEKKREKKRKKRKKKEKEKKTKPRYVSFLNRRYFGFLRFWFGELFLLCLGFWKRSPKP